MFSPVKQALKILRYGGVQRECPLCCHRLRSFRPGGIDVPVLRDYHVIGGGLRPDYFCPFCWSSDRERLVFLYLQRETQLLRGQRRLRVLHIAAEAQLKRVLSDCRGLEYIAADVQRTDGSVRMDLTATPCRDNSFDLIVCNHVLEHIQDDHTAMTELYRVLTPMGLAVLQVPIAPDLAQTAEDVNVVRPEERERVYGQADHVRLYGQDYPDRLMAVGFQVECFQPDQAYGPKDVYRYGLLPGEILYLARKEALHR